MIAQLVWYWYRRWVQRALLNEYRRLGRSGHGPRPLAYVRLRQALRGTIESGAVGPGQALPGERELAKWLALSRVTVRKAISGLVGEGLLTQRHGAGTFVADRIVRSFSKLTSFTDDLRARGLKPRSVFLAREIGEVTPAEAMALNLSPGARVVRLDRVRYAGEEPLAVERCVIPQSILPDPQVVENSLYEALEPLGCRPRRALQRLRAIALDPEQARTLDLPPGSPGLLIERRAFLDDGRVVEFTISYYRGDAYDFVAELQSE